MKVQTDLDVVECWCGIVHAIPAALHAEANRKGTTVHCPLGHAWVVGDPEIARLKRERDQLADAKARLIRQRDDEQKAHAATKGQLTKARKRAANGVCPCCKRSFVDVARHVRTKHPDFAEHPA